MTSLSLSKRRGIKRHESMRELAWRNMMILAINEGLRQNILPTHKNNLRPQSFTEPHVYKFLIDGKIGAIACVSYAGYDELAIRVSFWATEKADEVIKSCNGWFRAGEAYAFGWLMCRNGEMTLQGFDNGICCGRHLMKTVSSMKTQALGYEDRGPEPGYLLFGV